MTASLIKRLGPLLSASHEPGVGVGGSVSLRTFLAERIDIGPYSVRSPLVAVSGSGNGFFDVTWADGSLGAPAYMAGKAPHIAGVRVQGNKLTIRLRARAPDLLARLAQPFFCAVPSDTPIDPKGVTVISAGPYRVASY